MRSARDVAYALEAGDDTLALRLKLWLDAASTVARSIATSAPSTINTKRRKPERSLDDILVVPATCDLARDLQNRMRRPSTLLRRAEPLAPSARDQLPTFAAFPGRVEPTNNACEPDLRPAVIQRKNTDGYRAMWSVKGEAAVRTVVATACIASDAGTFSTVSGTIGA